MSSSKKNTAADKTLESFKNVLDSFVKFAGASGNLLQQRVASGGSAPDVECEEACVVCTPSKGIYCKKCAKKSQTDADKECAANKSKNSVTCSKSSSSTKNKSKSKDDKDDASSSSSDDDSSLCVCTEIRKIKEISSKTGKAGKSK